MVLKIQVVSDIHIEFWGNSKRKFFKPSADVLAMLGDIGCVASDEGFREYAKFVQSLLPLYKMIIIITGNHEYYFNKSSSEPKPSGTSVMSACDKKIKKLCTTDKKLVFLQNNSLKMTIDKQNYLIVGSTLWTWIPENKRKAIQSRMNDYENIYTQSESGIEKITSDHIAKLHVKNRRYITGQITRAKKLNAKVIVLTHHKPYKSEKTKSEWDSAYESDLSKLFKLPLVCWCYGHTHVKDDTTINGIRFVSNPKGYPNQRTLFSQNFVVEV